ncbi:hypothetical protein ACA910_001324 [Epithemia clementina (nom. ined.)]
MVRCGSKCIFLTFSKAVLNTKSDKSDSKVSSLWSSLFHSLCNTFETLSVHINNKLSSKKASNQVMANSPSVSGVAHIFKTCWEVRDCDTLWESICGSAVMSQQAGKCVAGWHAKVGDLTVGGQPPTFDDIEESMEPLLRFTAALFEDDTTKCWDPNVRELLVMALLLRYKQFLDVLRDPSHPEYLIPDAFHSYHPADKAFDLQKSQDFNSIQIHLFVCRIEQTLEKVGVDKVVFMQWCKDARKAFLSRNIPGILIEKFPSYGGTGTYILMDPRCFAYHFNLLASVAQSNHVMIQELRHRLNDMTKILCHEMNKRSFYEHNLRGMANFIRWIEERLLGDSWK